MEQIKRTNKVNNFFSSNVKGGVVGTLIRDSESSMELLKNLVDKK